MPEETRAREAAQRIRQLIAQGGADIEREQELDSDAGSRAVRPCRRTAGV